MPLCGAEDFSPTIRNSKKPHTIKITQAKLYLMSSRINQTLNLTVKP